MSSVLFLVAALIPLALSPAQAIDPLPYLDDRSTPESLVSSLYNAINRYEFARAHSYFAADAVEPFDSYKQSLADTDHFEVAVGIATSEGAAGSTFWRVPVALRQYADGAIATYAACYTLRLAQPQIQSPPFEPLHIVGVTFPLIEGQDGDLTAQIPDTCPD